jgi:hypothetical protein
MNSILRLGIATLAATLFFSGYCWGSQFNSPPQYTTGFDPFSAAGRPARMVAGDFNREGKEYVAVKHGVGFGSVVTVLLGNGDGTFWPAISCRA